MHRLQKKVCIIVEVWLWLSDAANGGWPKIKRLENLFGRSEVTNDLCKLNGRAHTAVGTLTRIAATNFWPAGLQRQTQSNA